MKDWIKTSERLPEVKLDKYDFTNNKILVYTEGDNIMCIDAILLHKSDSLYKPIVTHWMPLPDPPEKIK